MKSVATPKISPLAELPNLLYSHATSLFMVLYVVHAFEDPNSLQFQAIDELRRLADICIMLNGSPQSQWSHGSP